MSRVAGRAAAAAQVYQEGLCRAICRGLAKQKSYDSGLSCIRSIVLGRPQIGSIIEAAGLARPVGDWPEHYIDPMHEPDGGCDRVHRRVQDGSSGASALIAGWNMRCGMIPVAWDVVSDNAALGL